MGMRRGGPPDILAPPGGGGQGSGGRPEDDEGSVEDGQQLELDDPTDWRLSFCKPKWQDATFGHAGVGGGQQADARELQEAHVQPTDDAGNLSHACQDEEECANAGGGEDQEEHFTGFALGNDSETSE